MVGINSVGGKASSFDHVFVSRGWFASVTSIVVSIAVNAKKGE
jgi:hypothetical protein